MKTLTTITLLFIYSAAFGQKVAPIKPSQDTIKFQLSEEALSLLEQLSKESEELQKDAGWILVNTKLQAVQQKQLALVKGVQLGKGIKGTLVGIKNGNLLIIKQ
jgi:hypothetical protein